MARKKNAQPKRILETSQDDENNKRLKNLPTYYFPDRRTTNVIPADANHPWLATLPAFLTAFQDKLPQLRQELYQIFMVEKKADRNGWYKGFRFITGNRMEIKVLSEWLVEEFGGLWNPVQLIQYAQSQALKDERIIKNILEVHGQVQFSEWSMIVSNNCEAQTIHIDVPSNNYQFGLVLQDSGIPPTMVMSQHRDLETPEELFATIWKDAPESLKDSILKNTTIKGRMEKLLKAYGALLIPRKDLEASMLGGSKPLVSLVSAPEPTSSSEPQQNFGSGLRRGDLICTAGGIPHAGPACAEFRVVVFAAASPTKDSLYDVDEQYYAHSAILFAIQLVWDGLSSCSDGLQAKIWLLRKLANTVHDYESGIENHYHVSKAFVKMMEQVAKIYHGQEKVTKSTSKHCEGETDKYTVDPAKSDMVEEIISKFLQENATKPECDLFQFRPNTIFLKASESGRGQQRS